MVTRLIFQWMYEPSTLLGSDTKFPGLSTESKYLFWDNILSHTFARKFLRNLRSRAVFDCFKPICFYVFHVEMFYSITCLRHVLYLCYTYALICFYTYIHICIFIYKYLFQDNSWIRIIIIFCFTIYSDVVF